MKTPIQNLLNQSPSLTGKLRVDQAKEPMTITLPPLAKEELSTDDGHILFQDQLSQCTESIGTEREWQSIVLVDEECPAGVVALCHPVNAPAFAAVPMLLSALADAYTRADTAVRTQQIIADSPRSKLRNTDSIELQRLESIRDQYTSALLAAGCSFE